MSKRLKCLLMAAFGLFAYAIVFPSFGAAGQTVSKLAGVPLFKPVRLSDLPLDSLPQELRGIVARADCPPEFEGSVVFDEIPADRQFVKLCEELRFPVVAHTVIGNPVCLFAFGSFNFPFSKATLCGNPINVGGCNLTAINCDFTLAPTALSEVGVYNVFVVAIDQVTGCGEGVNVQIQVTCEITPPNVVFCPSDETIECTGPSQVLPFGTPEFFDECDQDLTVTSDDGPRVPGICPDVYSVTRTWTATDDCGNTNTTCQQTITVDDNTDPTISCQGLAPIAVQCVGDVPPCPASLAAFFTAGGAAADNCDASLDYSCSDGPLVGGPCGGTITRTHTVRDDCGKSASCDQLITVNDRTDPLISCPPNVTVECIGNVPAAATSVVELVAQGGSASDNCGLVMISHVDGPLVGGMITRTYKVVDACDNLATCDQIITADNTAPVITCPANIRVHTDSGNCVGKSVSFSPTITDNCPGVKMDSCVPPSGAVFPVGTTTVTCHASDAAENRSECQFSVEVFVLKGDLDGNGLLTPPDEILLLNCTFLGTGPCDLCFADVNCDGLLTPVDVVLEINAVYGGIPLPCQL